MNILTQIALLAALIACVSLLWLVGRAFGRHPGWGFAVLLLSPLTAILFGIRYWRDEKGPFLVYLATLAVAMTLGLYQLTVKGGWDIVRNALLVRPSATLQTFPHADGAGFIPTSLNAGEKPNVQSHRGTTAGTQPAQTQPARQNGGSEKVTTATVTGAQESRDPAKLKVTSAKPVEPKQRYRANYVPITPSMAEDYVGMTVKVKRLNGPEQDCVLRRVSPTTLGFEQHTRGGTFSFEYRQSDIEKLRVLVKQTY